VLAENSYGKSGIRLVKVIRREDGHRIRDLTVSIALEGDFEAAHVAGDNSAVLPTDTMKNTVYALARSHPLESIEAFARDLAEHFLRQSAEAAAVRVSISERPWERLALGTGAGGHPHAFSRPGGERRVARVFSTRAKVEVRAGIEDLTILKSAGSGFSGFLRDRYTTLKETEDRIFATSVQALWLYGPGDVSYSLLARAVQVTILETFANHTSSSVQHTLHAMGEAVLDRHPEVVEIRLSLPNKHHLLVDLSPFGLDNPNEVFVATEEPYGLIEATLRRGSVG
jgi:urate oxidase